MSESRTIKAEWISASSFAPYGQAIKAIPDGQVFGQDDAQLVLDRGVPRFYIMRLHHRGNSFDSLARHQQCTQCLGSLNGKEWSLGVAPPDAEPLPDLTRLKVFRIPGDCFVKLHLGTWHAGPYFEDQQVDFYNLELSDTNVTDGDFVDLVKEFEVEYYIEI